MTDATFKSAPEALRAPASGSHLRKNALHRRDLLKQSAALATIGQAGLLGAAILAPGAAHAVSRTYSSKTVVRSDQWYVDGVKYEWAHVRFSDGLSTDHYCVFRKANTTNAWRGMRYYAAADQATFITNYRLDDLTVTYDVIAVDDWASNWDDSGELRRASETNWALPENADGVQYYEISQTDATETTFIGRSYYLLQNGVRTYYLKYFFRENRIGIASGWWDSPITTVTGPRRTELITLFNTFKQLTSAYRISYGQARATVAMTAAGVLAGAIGLAIKKEEAPLWVMAIGMTTFIIAGAAVTAAALTASGTMTLAGQALLTKAEEFMSPPA